MSTSEAVRWIVVPAARPAERVRLVCFPHAGAGAAAYFRWRRMLPAWIAVCPVQLPGREIRLSEPARTHWTDVVDAVHTAAQVLGLLEDGVPLAIFGHSMGSLLAYEWARRLEALGLDVTALFVSGREAPQTHDRVATLSTLADEAMLAGVRSRFGLVADGLLDGPELRAVFLPILRADLALVESYRWLPGEPLCCAVRAFAGSTDLSVSDAGLGAWNSCTRGSFAMQRFTGDHFYPVAQAQPALLEAMVQTLADERPAK